MQKYKCLIVQIILLSSFNQVSAQDATYRLAPKFDYRQIYSTNHWNFLIRPLVYFGTSTQHPDPAIRYRFQPTSGVQIGWMYQFNKRRWGIQTGFNAELGWTLLDYHISKSYWSGMTSDDGTYVNSTYWDYFAYSVPLYFTYHLPLYDKHNAWLLDFKAGFDFKFGTSAFTGGSYSKPKDNNGNYFTSFADEKEGIPYKFFTNYHASIGFSYILPNKKLLNFAVTGSWCPSFIDQGTVTFLGDVPGKKLTSSYTKRYDYIGFELNYIFTRVRHMQPVADGYRVEPIFKPRKHKHIARREF